MCILYVRVYVRRFTRTRPMRGRFQKPPPNYVCHSCGGKDHFRQQCPKGKVGWMIAVGTSSVFMLTVCVMKQYVVCVS